MTTIPNRWHIPPAFDAAAVLDPGGRAERITRIAELDEERKADCLYFLAGYAPGVLDAVLAATELCVDDLLPPDEDAQEPYCAECGEKAGVFLARGSCWRHYRGTAEDGTAQPFDADHAPLIVWRPARPL
jgi:hypothetical protein